MKRKQVRKKKTGGTLSCHLPAILFALSAIVITLFIIELSQTAFDIIYRDTIIPGVSIGTLNISGLTVEEAHLKLQERVDELKRAGLPFCFKQHCIIVDALIIAPEDPDLSYELISLNVQEVIAQAYAVGRSGNSFARLMEQIKTARDGIRLSAEWNIQSEEIQEILKNNFSDKEKPAANADVAITQRGNNYIVAIEPAIIGWLLDYTEAFKNIKNALQNLELPSVKLTTITDYPIIETVDETEITKEITTILNDPQWNVVYKKNVWPLVKDSVSSLITLQHYNGQTMLGIRKNAFEEFINGIAPSIEHQVRDAKFVLKNGRVVEFQSSQDGVVINRPATLNQANALLAMATSTNTLSFPLVVDVTPSPTPTESVNNLGIKELLGVGRSNFAGSPQNRRHNNRIGAETLNGLLIPPNEEFSLIKALGDIDASNGYRQELVIKGNKTIPEYGGGLCQIGTTTFRATLESGLPITERQNHSYRVRYYEPAGTDATIYGPHPDFRFINDTGHYILIQTRIEGDELIFEFWGASDGRIAEQTKPIIYNRTSPPPTRYIETLDIPVGKTKCTEHAVPGADTRFTYTVTYADGEKKETEFTSHYRAWQEVCLIGVEKLKTIEPLDEKQPPDTEAVINSYN